MSSLPGISGGTCTDGPWGDELATDELLIGFANVRRLWKAPGSGLTRPYRCSTNIKHLPPSNTTTLTPVGTKQGRIKKLKKKKTYISYKSQKGLPTLQEHTEFNPVDRQETLYAAHQYDKNEQVLEWIAQQSFGIFGLAETGLNWDELRPSRSLSQHARRVNGPIPSVVVQAFNKHDTGSVTQWGGVALIIRGKWVSRASDYQVDSKG